MPVPPGGWPAPAGQQHGHVVLQAHGADVMRRHRRRRWRCGRRCPFTDVMAPGLQPTGHAVVDEQGQALGLRPMPIEHQASQILVAGDQTFVARRWRRGACRAGQRRFFLPASCLSMLRGCTCRPKRWRTELASCVARSCGLAARARATNSSTCEVSLWAP